MTRVINQRQKKQQFTSSTQQTQICKTKVELNQKNIAKLIFVESDDDKSEDQCKHEELRKITQSARIRQYTNDLDFHREKPFNKQFKIDSKVLKPSLMRGHTDNQEQYEQIINYQNFRPQRANQSQIVKNKLNRRQQNYLFQELVDHRERIRNSKMERKQLPRSFFDQKSIKNIEKIQNKQAKKQEQSIVIPKLQIANICFEISDEQPCQSTSKQLVNPKIQKDLDGFQNIGENSSSKFSQQSQEHNQIVDITQTSASPQIFERSKYLYQMIKGQKIIETQLVGLMITPILPSTKQVFQLQVYSGLTQKFFTFWLDMGQELRLLMRANKMTKLSKTVYEFHTYDEKSKQYIQTSILQSNVDRSLYNLFVLERKTNKKRILATYSQTYNIKNSKLIVIYFPKIKANNQAAYFYDSQQSTTNLQNVFRQNKIHEVDYAMTTKMDIGSKLKLMDFYNLKSSQKSMEFKNSDGNMQVIIGKKQSKRYKIIAGAGLSPLQIFGLAIAQIQT